jgi:pilus assembly protein CpaB
MNKRLLSVLVFGIAVSAIASFVLYRFLSARMAVSAKPSTIPVVVAAKALPTGSLIKDGDVKVVDWSGSAPAGATSKIGDVDGRGVIAAIYEGEPVIDGRLAPKGAGGGMAATIPSGMRAVAVAVNDVVGVAGFVVPGMRVDVLASGNGPTSNGEGTQTRTVLQNIEVLSAGQNIQKDTEGKPVSVQVVNLLVTPEQAETLSLASHETRIQLVLRNPLDKDLAKTPGTALARLFGAEARPAATHVVRKAVTSTVPPAPPVVDKPAPAPPIVVEVIQGSTRKEMKFSPQEEVIK